MTSTDLRAWRRRHRLNITDAAAALGCARNSISAWEGGQAIPRYIAMACAAYSFGLPPLGG